MRIAAIKVITPWGGRFSAIIKVVADFAVDSDPGRRLADELKAVAGPIRARL
jgi:hypothetical protein